jgi:hypothetical protein
MKFADLIVANARRGAPPISVRKGGVSAARYRAMTAEERVLAEARPVGKRSPLPPPMGKSSPTPPPQRRPAAAPRSYRYDDYNFSHLVEGAVMMPQTSELALSPLALFASQLSTREIERLWDRALTKALGSQSDSRADPKIQAQWDRAFTKI